MEDTKTMRDAIARLQDENVHLKKALVELMEVLMNPYKKVVDET